jgi:hypothetical protein
VLEQTVKPNAVIMLMMIDVDLLNSLAGLGRVGVKSTHISSLCVQIEFPYLRVSGYSGLARSERHIPEVPTVVTCLLRKKL